MAQDQLTLRPLYPEQRDSSTVSPEGTSTLTLDPWGKALKVARERRLERTTVTNR